jgi:hypothetical protein
MNDTSKAYELYGDKILIGVIPTNYDENAPRKSSGQRQGIMQTNSAALTSPQY